MTKCGRGSRLRYRLLSTVAQGEITEIKPIPPGHQVTQDRCGSVAGKRRLIGDKLARDEAPRTRHNIYAVLRV